MNIQSDFVNGQIGKKDIYEASLINLNPMTILNTPFEANSCILYFDEIQEMAFRENKGQASSTGGFNNTTLVSWEYTKSIDGIMKLGVIDPFSLGIANATKAQVADNKEIRQYEKKSSDESGYVSLRHNPIADTIKIYELENGKRIREIVEWTLDGNTLKIEDSDILVLVEYTFIYESSFEQINVGLKDINGYFSFCGKFRYTDEYTAEIKTGLIEIPRLRIKTNFAINLGRNATPVITTLEFEGIPTGPRGKEKALVFSYLGEDIDCDL